MARRRNPLGKRFDVPKTKGLVLARLGQTGRTLCEPENPDLYASEAQVADCYRCLKLIDLNQQSRGSILSVPTRGNPLPASVQAVLDSGGCGEEDADNVFYHATPSRYVTAILKDGLRPGLGATFKTDAWSKGKVFLSAGWTNAVRWQDFIEEQTGEPVAILGVALPEVMLKLVRVDTVAKGEGDPCAFYLTHTVPPGLLEVEDVGSYEENPLRANTIFERQFIPSHEGAIYDSSGSPYRQQHSMIVGGRQGTWIGKKKKKTKGAKPSSPFTSKLAEGKTPPKARTQSKKTRAYLDRQKAAHDEGRASGLEAAIEHLIEEAKLKAMAREDMPLETRQGLILYFVEGWPVSDQPGAEERLREEMRKHPAQFQALRSTTKGFRAKKRAPYGSRKRKLPRLKTNPPKSKERTMARRTRKKNPVHHLSRRELVLLAQMETARMGRKVSVDELVDPQGPWKGRLKQKGGKRKSAANPSRRRNSEKLTAAEQRELEKAFGKKAKLGKKQKRGTVREDVYSYYGARPSYATPVRSRFVVNKKAKKVRYCRADGKTIWCTPKQARAYRRNRG